MAELLARLVELPAAFAVWIGQQRERWREWRQKPRACCTKCHAEVDAEELERRRQRREQFGAWLGLPSNAPPLDGQVMEKGWRLFGEPHTTSCGVCGTTRADRCR